MRKRFLRPWSFYRFLKILFLDFIQLIFFFIWIIVNYFSALSSSKITVLDIINTVFFQFFVTSQNTQVLFECNFCLRMYVACIFNVLSILTWKYRCDDVLFHSFICLRLFERTVRQWALHFSCSQLSYLASTANELSTISTGHKLETLSQERERHTYYL